MPRRRPKPRDPRPVREHQLQAAVVQHLMLFRAPGVFWHSVPNEGKRSEREATRLKLLGMLPGVADLAVVLPGGCVHYLELKAGGKLSRTSDDQRAFRALCEGNGSPYAIADTIEDATRILAAWGALEYDPLARPAPQARAA